MLTFANSTDVNFIATQAIARSKDIQAGVDGTNGTAEDQLDAMKALERQARAPAGFVAASTGPEGGNRPDPTAEAMTRNEDEIDLGDDL